MLKDYKKIKSKDMLVIHYLDRLYNRLELSENRIPEYLNNIIEYSSSRIPAFHSTKDIIKEIRELQSLLQEFYYEFNNYKVNKWASKITKIQYIIYWGARSVIFTILTKKRVCIVFISAIIRYILSA